MKWQNKKFGMPTQSQRWSATFIAAYILLAVFSLNVLRKCPCSLFLKYFNQTFFQPWAGVLSASLFTIFYSVVFFKFQNTVFIFRPSFAFCNVFFLLCIVSEKSPSDVVICSLNGLVIIWAYLMSSKHYLTIITVSILILKCHLVTLVLLANG